MRVVPHHSDSQVGRVAERFAVSALAGELAIEWGVLPWTKGNASWAAETCFLDWVAQRGGTGSSEQLRSIHAVLKFIDMHRVSRFLDWDAPDDQRAPNLAGYRVQNPVSGMEDYLFHPAGWEEASKGFDPGETAKAMLKEGLLQEVREGAKKRLVYGKNMRRGGVLCRYHIVTGAGIAAYLQRQEEQRHTSNPTFNTHQEGGDL
jgi:putative DNA primase/helicase